MEQRFICRACRRIQASSSILQRHWLRRTIPHARQASTGRSDQANPLGGYYESLISQPLSHVTAATRSAPAPPTAPLPKTEKEETLAKARIVFGSRLAGPAERRAEINKKSTLVAGVWVPPRPTEPDNCCMSGCVNCVWDRYGDDLEEWAAAKKQADHNLRKEKAYEKRRRAKKTGTGMMLGDSEKGAEHTLVSMDDDGGGSDTNWGTGLDTDLTSDELFKGIPVGIREFMKQEKRLKEKHLREGTEG